MITRLFVAAIVSTIVCATGYANDGYRANFVHIRWCDGCDASVVLIIHNPPPAGVSLIGISIAPWNGVCTEDCGTQTPCGFKISGRIENGSTNYNIELYWLSIAGTWRPGDKSDFSPLYTLTCGDEAQGAIESRDLTTNTVAVICQWQLICSPCS